jgi:radical SAM superfamily enzyme YgiQ (UPF0313 family)
MSDATPIDPVRDLGAALLRVEKPARYTGGEYGLRARPDAAFQTAIAFPDLYEIGMSNQALRILYNRLNELPGISCDRVFAPAPDFEAVLRERSLPLYGLDTGIPLKKLDLLLFTLGYELGITSALTILDLAGIPIRREGRGEGDPVVIMGGPCVSNPLPYAAFIDAFWIGEAEAGFFELTEKLAARKKEGRGALLSILEEDPHIWTWGKGEARRAIDRGFAAGPAAAAVFPVPSMKVVQHHGAVEIMRGCPNGCRFCHAGFWYRPMRQKPEDTIIREAEAFINRGGYREISLSSLSSGDYAHIDHLVDRLNRNFADRHISFQLPSLKVSGFSLSLLEKISETRKSGLTFAVETPEEGWQLAINKTVSRDNTLAILREAKKRGWRGAKFYFMIGLPVGDRVPGGRPEKQEASESAGGNSEEARIVDFIAGLGRAAGMHFTINVGIFVPKPHTPFERAAQIGMDTARQKLDHIRSRLKPLGHKVSVQDPLTSVIEGLLSRGDERAGDLAKAAFDRGCRLDAWTDYLKRDIWEELLESHKDLEEETRMGKAPGIPLAWNIIDPGVSPGYLKGEFTHAQKEEFTSPCIENCTYNCGICRDDVKTVYNNIHGDNLLYEKPPGRPPEPSFAEPPDPLSQTRAGRDPSLWRIVFSFSKEGRAVFLSHLSLIEVFSMAMIRAGVPVLYTGGFNPLPKLEICAPLSIGISAEGEIAAIDTGTFFAAGDFIKSMNKNLPQGIEIRGAGNYVIPGGAKKYSLSSQLWGFSYAGDQGAVDLVKAAEEKKYRLSRGGGSVDAAENAAVFGLRRLSVLARDPQNPDQGRDFFTAYRSLYPDY